MSQSSTPFVRSRRERLVATVAEMAGARLCFSEVVDIAVIGEIDQAMARGVERELALSPFATLVRVLIDSEGGELRSGRRIYELLRSRADRSRIVATARLCASAATLILLAADFRDAAPQARFVVHEAEAIPTSPTRWTAATHRRSAAVLDRVNRELATIYSQRTGHSAAIFEAEMSRDRSMGISAAQRIGLIHGRSSSTAWIGGKPFHSDE